MKTALSFRTTFLTGCAAFVLCAGSLQASDSPPPSIEIHLDVLSHLKGAPAAAASPAKTAKSHEKKTAATKHEKKTKHAKAAAPETKTQAASEAPPPAPEVKAEAPAPVAPAAAITPAAPTPATPPALPSAPEAAAPDAGVPKLPASDLAAAEPNKAAPKHEGMISGMTGGMGDLLGGDSDKPKADAGAKPASPPAAGAPPLLSDKDLPAASSPALPAPAPDATKMASNDVPPLAAPAPAAGDGAKSELPAPSTPPDLQTAQSTLTPLPGSPPAAAAPPAAATPPALEAAPPAPAPAAALPPVVATPTPATPAAPAPAAPPAEQAVAGTPDLRIAFSENETEVPLASTAQLDTLAKSLHDNPALRVNIMAYASGPDTAGIYPKRVSLARGIAVRNYLTTNKGIDIERVNVKALGNKNAGGPGDRVDVYMLK